MTKAIQINQFGGPDVMQCVDVAVGEPGKGEIRIRHHASGLNYIDVYHRTGLYPMPLPLILGVEGAGVVEAVGAGVTHLNVGDRAAYVSAVPGGYSEARVLLAQNVVKLPDAIDFDTAAGMMLKGLTAQYLLKRTQPQGGLHPGDFILWHAAAGGVGLIACQWARVLGLQPIATAGSDDKCQLALTHGAAFAINYRRENFVERVNQITGGTGVKVVYDSVGKDTFEGSLACLRPFGLLASFGNASGPVPPFAPGILAPRSLYLTRGSVYTHLASQSATQQMADELFDVVLKGEVRIRIERRYALTDAAQAHRDLEARTTTGSGVLIP